MFFGNEHLGSAVAFLRDGQDLKQYELAAKIGLKPGTLNQYETGRRGMSETLVKKIAAALQLDPITIWDTAFRIFRYNYFLERANEEGISVEDLIDRVEARPSVGQLMEIYDSVTERERQYTESVLRFLDPAGKPALDSASLLKVVVNLRSRRIAPKKAVRFDQKTPQRRET